MSPSRIPYRPISCTGRFLLHAALAVMAAWLMVMWSPAQADDSQALKAEGPYFQVQSDDPGVDALPLKSTRVDVRIAGVIADVTVTQQYRNEGQRPIEARYVFPGSSQAAVHAMTVRLGERVLTARIQEKQRARIEYDAARREGRTAALLDQERPNVFQMSVANILPGDDVQVELRYTELIAPTEGRYQFVYPTVVGPRYHRPVSQGGTSSFPATAHLQEGVASDTAFDLRVHLGAPLPVSDITSSSHRIEVSGEDSTQADIALVGDGPRDNRDFILEYRLGGERTATGLMLYQGADENFFLALVEPPKAIAPVQVSPREYVFVVDISGSMQGYPLKTAKALLRELIGNLRASDSFNVMLFSGSNQMLNDTPVPATRANIDRAIKVIDRVQGGGSTEIVPALKRIAALPKNPEVSRSVIVVTDGYVTVENDVFRLVRRNLGESNVFAFGIGSSVNRHLIEGIARAGAGEPFIVTKPEHAAAQAERLRKMIDSPVLTQLRARFVGLDVYDVEPAQLPDVLGGRPVLVYGKWRSDRSAPAVDQAPGQAPRQVRGLLVLEGRAATGDHRDVVEARAADPQAGALRHLWARQRIQQLSDQEALEGGSAQRDEITSLGLKYSLLTQYTSFLAVDQVVRSSGTPVPVTQPLPLPEGVGNAAIGTAVPGTPEPGVWAALAMAGLFTAWAVRRRRGAPGARA
jgi:Ca-activated chloride channel family protein